VFAASVAEFLSRVVPVGGEPVAQPAKTPVRVDWPSKDLGDVA